MDGSDDQLLAATPDDAEAFAAFYRRHERDVLAFFQRRTRSPELAAGGAAREAPARPDAGGVPVSEPSGPSGPSGPTGPTGTPGGNDFVPVGTIAMKAKDGSRAVGEVAIFASQSTQDIGFQLVGKGLAPSRKGEAYGTWLVGGGRPHFLGYAPPVQAKGRTRGQLGTTGPRERDTKRFARWLQTSRRFVLTLETQEIPKRPGRVVLSGTIADFQQIDTGKGAPSPTAIPPP